MHITMLRSIEKGLVGRKLLSRTGSRLAVVVEPRSKRSQHKVNEFLTGVKNKRDPEPGCDANSSACVNQLVTIPLH